MSLSIKQQNEVYASTISLGYQPDDTSTLHLFVEQANSAAPAWCATSWALVAQNPDQWKGTGPFSGSQVRLTAGRTPPSVNAVIVEVGP